jgi:hypothetical protein
MGRRILTMGGVCAAVTLIASTIVLLSGCSSESNPASPATAPRVLDGAGLPEAQCELAPYSTLQQELRRVRAATERYRDVNAAVADGYEDIHLYIPMMGWHYLKSDLLDASFDPERPELLVYADMGVRGARQLVAVEYAVPLDLAEEPPSGFSCDEDIWTRNTTFQLWTLHTWTWLPNPDGIFAPMNPKLP